MKRNVMIRILTVRTGLPISLFDPDTEEPDEQEGENGEEMEEADEVESLTPEQPADTEESEKAELLLEGRLIAGKTRVELVYEESELTGMDGSVTTIGFDRDTPGLVSMLRSGTVHTALVFEKGKRHICVYNTPFSEFEVCVEALEVRNDLLESGILVLDYMIEIHGARAERCTLTITVRDDKLENCRSRVRDALMDAINGLE